MPARQPRNLYSTPLHRMLAILRLVANEPGWTVPKLARHFGVNEMTIHRDRRRLAACGIVLAYDAKRKGYGLANNSFILPTTLTADEALALTTVCEHICGREQIAFLTPAAEALNKIREALPPALREEIARLSRHVVIRTARGAPPDSAQSYADVFQRMREAIATGRALSCRYESAHGRGQWDPFVFHPYTLLFCVRAWYVVGWHGTHRDIRCLKLSRFLQARVLRETYAIPADFSIESYLGNAWLMIRGQPEYQVELRIAPQFAETFADTLWHPTQKIEPHDDGTITFRCTVAGLDEIVWAVLGFGPFCRVVHPPELAAKVRELAAATACQYAPPGSP